MKPALASGESEKPLAKPKSQIFYKCKKKVRISNNKINNLNKKNIQQKKKRNKKLKMNK